MTGYTLPDGQTLKNLVGALSPDELDTLEGPLVSLRAYQMHREGRGPTGAFGLDRFKATDHHLFQDVYAWAGHTRDERVRLPDGETAVELHLRKVDGAPFAVGPQIRRGLDHVFGRLAGENELVGLLRDEFATKAASYFAEINSLHAFRKGNGRTQRAFFESLAQNAGHALEFDVVSRERMIVASIAAHEQGDVSQFRRMFREISDPERIASLRQAQQFLDRQKFRWRDLYMSITEPGRTYDLTMVGKGGAHFMAHAQDGALVVGRSRDLPDPNPASGARFTLTTARETQEQKPDSAQRHTRAEGEGSRPTMRQKPR